MKTLYVEDELFKQHDEYMHEWQKQCEVCEQDTCQYCEIAEQRNELENKSAVAI